MDAASQKFIKYLKNQSRIKFPWTFKEIDSAIDYFTEKIESILNK